MTTKLTDETHEQYVERMMGDIHKNVKSITTAVTVFFLLFLFSVIIGSCSVLF